MLYTCVEVVKNERKVMSDVTEKVSQETRLLLSKEQLRRHETSGKRPTIKALIAEAVRRTFGRRNK